MCSAAAAVQGMDETVNNGAQAFYLKVSGEPWSVLLKTVAVLLTFLLEIQHSRQE